MNKTSIKPMESEKPTDKTVLFLYMDALEDKWYVVWENWVMYENEDKTELPDDWEEYRDYDYWNDEVMGFCAFCNWVVANTNIGGYYIRCDGSGCARKCPINKEICGSKNSWLNLFVECRETEGNVINSVVDKMEEEIERLAEIVKNELNEEEIKRLEVWKLNKKNR